MLLESRRMRFQARGCAKLRRLPIFAFATSTKLAGCMTWGPSPESCWPHATHHARLLVLGPTYQGIDDEHGVPVRKVLGEPDVAEEAVRDRHAKGRARHEARLARAPCGPSARSPSGEGSLTPHCQDLQQPSSCASTALAWAFPLVINEPKEPL